MCVCVCVCVCVNACLSRGCLHIRNMSSKKRCIFFRGTSCHGLTSLIYVQLRSSSRNGIFVSSCRCTPAHWTAIMGDSSGVDWKRSFKSTTPPVSRTRLTSVVCNGCSNGAWSRILRSVAPHWSEPESSWSPGLNYQASFKLALQALSNFPDEWTRF